MVTALEKVKIKDKWYFQDNRLQEFRAVDNPSDIITFQDYRNKKDLMITNTEKGDKILEIVKQKDIRIYKAIIQNYNDAHSGDFRDIADYNKKTSFDVAFEMLDYFNSKDVVMVKKTRQEIKDYDYNKENFKNCPVCPKVINYHIDGFYNDEILNKWICREHKLKEILKVIELKK